MEIEIENIGKIKNAKITIDSITVIAGKNNTGKSTISKALWSVFNAFFQANKRIDRERKSYLRRMVGHIFFTKDVDEDYFVAVEDFIEKVIATGNDNDDILLEEKIKSEILKSKIFSDILSDDELDGHIDEIINGLRIPQDFIFARIIERITREEFREQINCNYDKSIGKIILTTRKKRHCIEFSDNRVINIPEVENFEREPLYIDNPFVLDYLSKGFLARRIPFAGHRKHLCKLLLERTRTEILNEILSKERLNNIYMMMDKMCSGNLFLSEDGSVMFTEKCENKKDNTVYIENVSAGLKSFAIIKTLLQDGRLEKNGTIILDEPEIHLHPEWQIVFAELIILLQKEFGLHILLSTHSPYFLRAIELCCMKYGVKGAKFYLTSTDDSGFNIVEDVSSGVDKIYKLLAEPFQVLEDMRYGD